MPLDLNRLLFKEGADFNFFQAVHLLERLQRDAGQVGTGAELRSEGIRFETDESIAFPSSDIRALLPPKSLQTQAEELEAVNKAVPKAVPDAHSLSAESRGPLRMILTFMGLYGVSSPLPSYFTDPITLQRLEYFELRKFLDMFGHRLYSEFYRAWKKYRHPAQFLPGGTDGYSRSLLAMVGQSPAAAPKTTAATLRPRPDLRRIRFARFLGHRVRSARSLESLLQGYFGFPRVKVRQFAAAWLTLPASARLGSPHALLGCSTYLGERMLDHSGTFVVEIGPLPRAQYELFLGHGASSDGTMVSPGSPDASHGSQPSGVDMRTAVSGLIEDFLLDPLSYRVEVLLEIDNALTPALGSDRALLGASLWLGERPREALKFRFSSP